MIQVSRKVPSQTASSPSSTLEPLVSNSEHSLHKRRYSNNHNDSCCTTTQEHQHQQHHHQQQPPQNCHQQQQQQYYCNCTSNKCIAFIVLLFVITMTILQIPSNNQYLLLFNPTYNTNNDNDKTNTKNTKKKNEFITKASPTSSSFIRTKSPSFQQLDSFPTTSYEGNTIDDSDSKNNNNHIINRHSSDPDNTIYKKSNNNNNNNNEEKEDEDEDEDNGSVVVDEENENENEEDGENDDEEEEEEDEVDGDKEVDEEEEEDEEEDEEENDDEQHADENNKDDDLKKGERDDDRNNEDDGNEDEEEEEQEEEDEEDNDDNNERNKKRDKGHVNDKEKDRHKKGKDHDDDEKGNDDNKDKKEIAEEEDDEENDNNKKERNYVNEENEPHWEENLTPQIVWLVSYPNSGTSYTMTLVERASNLSTATNYGNEVTYKDHDAIPIYPNHNNGPFWEGSSDHAIQLNRIQRPLPTKYVLTKTHCGGRCIKCPASEYLVNTTRQFLYGCQKTSYRHQGTMITTEFGAPLSSIKRIIHLIRNPYHNVVARFHLERKNMIAKDNSYESLFPYDATGFYNWCHYLDTTYNFDDIHLLPKHIYKNYFDPNSDQHVTCAAEFYKWTQWHNYVIQSPTLLGLPRDRTETIRIEQSDDNSNSNDSSSSRKRKVSTMKEKSIPVHTVYYEDYEMNFNTTFINIMNFLQLPIATEQIRTFRSLPTYDDHYNKQQRNNIKELIKSVATKHTWKLIQHYF